MEDEETARRPALSEIRKRYAEERFYQDDRAAAEYAYALAFRLREIGETDEARGFARECLELAMALPSRTLDDVASERLWVGGVPLPDHFHDGVVRARLADLLA